MNLQRIEGNIKNLGAAPRWFAFDPWLQSLHGRRAFRLVFTGEPRCFVPQP